MGQIWITLKCVEVAAIIVFKERPLLRSHPLYYQDNKETANRELRIEKHVRVLHLDDLQRAPSIWQFKLILAGLFLRSLHLREEAHQRSCNVNHLLRPKSNGRPQLTSAAHPKRKNTRTSCFSPLCEKSSPAFPLAMTAGENLSLSSIFCQITWHNAAARFSHFVTSFTFFV